eukprot:12805613-Alexandrium_andersonii.AAC.1
MAARLHLGADRLPSGDLEPIDRRSCPAAWAALVGFAPRGGERASCQNDSGSELCTSSTVGRVG